MNKELFEALDVLEKEKGISKDYMIEKIEAALLSAYRKENGGYENARVKLNPAKQDIKLYKQLTVVEEVIDPATEILLSEAQLKSKRYKVGDIYEIEQKTKTFGRIAAQAAKQVIIQGIREAERGNMIREYEEKKEEIVSAVVVRVDPTTGNATLEIGKNEMVLFRNEQIPGETLQVGDRIKVFITEIKKETRGPSIVLSRVHPGLVSRLFELEVPEIKDGTVEIKRIAREAGSRTKIAVISNDDKVDAIGSCIGPKGARKNNITAELFGEKLDIIPYSEDTEAFISAALAPATVESVTKLPDSDRAYRVIVADDQLSLAIGKEGQNARLAAKLTGFKIDIKSSHSAIED
ncbi:MAG: transcription termination/antitermination protein NusA [Clostridia bacterium]|nr:transcription termination/antitermination protein NusA [Clostridia bacterium]MBR6754876.1 transcription termination/antitermination protein NusA [Clostridia bacterium]